MRDSAHPIPNLLASLLVLSRRWLGQIDLPEQECCDDLEVGPHLSEFRLIEFWERSTDGAVYLVVWWVPQRHTWRVYRPCVSDSQGHI